MKIWLNDREVKETNRFIMCNKCVFKRETGYRQTLQCLAKTFHLLDQACMHGYQYESEI